MSQKDVLYIDIEDDITAIIEKAVSSKNPITALVLPKRYAVLQSLVNMKLLKKAVDKAGKKVVLITSEATLLPVAGMAGIYVADTLQSRPAVPVVEAATPLQDNIIDESEVTSPVQPAQQAETSASKSDTSAKKDTPKKEKPQKASKAAPNDKDSKIPNFDRFKKKILIGVGVFVLLVILWVVGYVILPSATIAIRAQTTRVETNLDFTLDPNATADDVDKKILIAETKELKKSAKQSFEATGEKDIGKKASGVMTVQNCESSSAISIPANTRFVDNATGFVFVSATAVSVPGGVFSDGGTTCNPGEANTNVTAQKSGDAKNLAPRAYSVSGFSSTVTAQGGQMSGGTSEVVKVVTQADVDAATKELLEQKDEETMTELRELFNDSTFIIEDTYTANNGTPSSSPAVGAQADKAELSVDFVYTITGVNRDAISEILEKDQLSKVSSPDQSILENGLDDAVFVVSEGSGKRTANIKTNGFAGPEINIEALKEEVAGKRYGEVISIVKSKEGVRDVTADFSPFWVFSAPSRASKITINIEVTDQPLQ